MKNLNKIKIILLLLTFNVKLSLCQKEGVKIIQDERIEGIISKQSKIIPPSTRQKIDGFRIQLFFDSNKENINAARGLFIANHKKIDTYIAYRAPNFFLKAGDFRTRLEAEKVRSTIESLFPTSFVIKEKINLPRLEQKNSFGDEL